MNEMQKCETTGCAFCNIEKLQLGLLSRRTL